MWLGKWWVKIIALLKSGLEEDQITYCGDYSGACTKEASLSSPLLGICLHQKVDIGESGERKTASCLLAEVPGALSFPHPPISPLSHSGAKQPHSGLMGGNSSLFGEEVPPLSTAHFFGRNYSGRHHRKRRKLVPEQPRAFFRKQRLFPKREFWACGAKFGCLGASVIRSGVFSPLPIFSQKLTKAPETFSQ